MVASAMAARNWTHWRHICIFYHFWKLRCHKRLKSLLYEVKQHTMTWANTDPDLCHHMASMGHNELNWVLMVTLFIPMWSVDKIGWSFLHYVVSPPYKQVILESYKDHLIINGPHKGKRLSNQTNTTCLGWKPYEQELLKMSTSPKHIPRKHYFITSQNFAS